MAREPRGAAANPGWAGGSSRGRTSRASATSKQPTHFKISYSLYRKLKQVAVKALEGAPFEARAAELALSQNRRIQATPASR